MTPTITPGRPGAKPRRERASSFSMLAWLLVVVSTAFACQPVDPRIPRQVDAPSQPVVNPIVAEPKPPPPPAPPPPPPRNGAELFERTTGEAWDDRSAITRLCESVANATADSHLAFARPPTPPPSPEALLAQLDTLATDLDSTLDLMQQVAESNAPPAESARLCLGRLAQIRAELFSSPHLFRAFAPHASHPRIKNLVAVLKRSGAHLNDTARARLAELTQEAERIRIELETSPSTSSTRTRLIELLRVRHRIAEALGHPSFAAYSASAGTRDTAAAIAQHLERLAEKARPALERELADLPGLVPGGLDELLVQKRTITRASEGAAPEQTVLGPWPYRPISIDRETPWWNRLREPAATPWDSPMLPVFVAGPTPEPPYPARAIGFMRQLQLAVFWLAAHELPDHELSEDRLDTLWADTLERFGLSGAYPAAAWPAFTGLASSPGYHLFIDAHLDRLDAVFPGPDPLLRWLEHRFGPAPSETAPTE